QLVGRSLDKGPTSCGRLVEHGPRMAELQDRFARSDLGSRVCRDANAGPEDCGRRRQDHRGGATKYGCGVALIPRHPSWTVSPFMAHRDLASRIHVGNAAESGQTRTDANDRAPQGRELPVREGLTRIIVDWSGS